LHPKIAAVLLAATLSASCTLTRPPATADHPGGGLASQLPPAGLAPGQVPLFVQFGFDDNAISGQDGSGTTGGVRFVRELFEGKRNPAGSGFDRTYDGTPARFSMYFVTRHLERPEIDKTEYVRQAWKDVADAGHEVGLHTHNHPHGRTLQTDQWLAEINTCRLWLTTPEASDAAAGGITGMGIDPEKIVGFRTPYLEHGRPLFPALRAAGISYDCSIEEGYEPQFHAGNFYWPYRVTPGYGGPLAAERELWEIPVYALVVPPDDQAARYGIAPGLRDRMHATRDYFQPADGKITGFDWNLWVEFGLKPAEVVAIFKYSLNQRLAGNRAPLTFGAHSDLYSEQYPETLPNTTAEERRQALREILDYALSKPEVRVVSAQQILDWVRNPAALR
jgi:peptidoglycan/xylan/chitin deacetylase (PgdA/CDA1 family)